MPVCHPVHRSFSDEHGAGTFCSLGILPKRTHKESSVFRIPCDDSDSDSSLDEHPPPSVRSRPASQASFVSPCPSPTLCATSLRVRFSRAESAPVLLSNGKPLKSSLKTPFPAVMIPPQAQNMHIRARSEPNTPKSVHFPETDYALATVRVFNRSARPAALSSPTNGDETETDGEDTPPIRFASPTHSSVFHYEIDPTKSSPIPSKSPSPANLLLESLNLSHSLFSSTNSSTRLLLTGSILVRNLAFEKHVAVRFTLDDWQTISEVGAHYVDSVPLLPSNLPPPLLPTPGDVSSERDKGWDRFTFIIHLEDYAHSLSTRTLWIAARYRINSTYPEPGSSQHGPGGEWWDNNDGKNYRIVFRPVIATPPSFQSRPYLETIIGPASSMCTRVQPQTRCKEHVLDFMVTSHNRKGELPCAGKLNLCNYAPPKVRATPCTPFPSASSSRTWLLSSVADSAVLPSTMPWLSSDEDRASPASSTLSTPTTSPTIIPRVITNGQPATVICSSSPEEYDDIITPSRPEHIEDWDWPAPNKPRIDGSSHPPVSGSELHKQRHHILLPLERNAPSECNLLYDTFVNQWCFAQRPSPGHDGGGITT